MTLKEAREIVEELREMEILQNSVSVAAILLDDRTTELEECLRDLKYAVIKEFGEHHSHSIHVNKAIEKARKLLEGKSDGITQRVY